MNQLPHWARKPKHKKEVIATSRGWEVKGTGEVLTSVRGLDEKLKELFSDVDTLKKEVTVSEPKTKEPEAAPVVKEEEKEPEPEEAPKKPAKRRGRPPKKKPEDTE